MSELPEWVRKATALPLLFAQVREDARQDVELVRGISGPVRVLLVASGGCTAAALSTLPNVTGLHLVDANPSQLALARLKLRLRERVEPNERLAILGHAPLPPPERAWRLKTELAALELGEDALGPLEEVAEVGPDQAGRYEHTFAALRERLDESAWEAVLSLKDPAEQARRAEPLAGQLAAAFDEVFTQSNLVALFGEGALQGRIQPFAAHFTERTLDVLGRLPAATNPYLWQVLLGRYPPAARAPWLDLRTGTSPAHVTWEIRGMDQTLADAPPGSFGYVHLSNILDWLSPVGAARTLALAARALAPGGRIVIRQLNSILDVRAAGPGLRWDEGLSDRLHARDRSFFYRALHVGHSPA